MVPQIPDGVAVQIQKICDQTDGVAHSNSPSQDRRP
jgi:hypothetical protein